MPSDLARRTRPVWQFQAVPALSALLPALPGVSRVGLRSAPTRLLRQPGEEVFHPLRFTAPHGAQAPRGALFHIDTALGRRLYALAFLEHGTRRLHITGITANPTREWTVQQARNLAADLDMRMESLRFLLRDRDGKYGQAFDAVFETEELDVIKSAPRAPRMNAHCERVIGSIRREVLDHVLILGEAHARQVLAVYQSHYNEHRPHQARTQLPPDAQNQPAATDTGAHRLLRTRILGGLISKYRYAA